MDVTVICGDCQSYTTIGHSWDANKLTEDAVTEKAKHHQAECNANGYDYLTIAASTYGGLSREFMDKHFLSHYKTKKAEAKAAGTSTWEVPREKEEWLQRFGVAIAKGNRHMIATAQTARGY